jgi:hypothetical protein
MRSPRRSSRSLNLVEPAKEREAQRVALLEFLPHPCIVAAPRPGSRRAIPSAAPPLRPSANEASRACSLVAGGDGDDNGSVRQVIDTASFPESPGVYVVYRVGDDCPLYVGVAATQTIAERWRKQHLYPRAGGSALRRSLGVHLGLVTGKLRRSDGRYYPADVEQQITAFLKACEIELFSTANADEADDLEVELRERLRPELNIATGRRRRFAR